MSATLIKYLPTGFFYRCKIVNLLKYLIISVIARNILIVEDLISY